MRLHRLALAFAAVFGAIMLPAPARANVMIIIDKSAQKMSVTVNGEARYVWPVSTGRGGYDTPSGEFQPFRMERDHFSREWDDAPMPNSIFFTKIGHAIHGTYEARNLGRPVSHGCVRLSTQNAATLYALVKDEGVFNTRVRLAGTAPQSDEPVARRDRSNGNDRDGARSRDSDRDTGRNRAYVRNYTDDETADAPPQRTRPMRGWQTPDPRLYFYYRPQPYYYSSPYYERRSYGRGLFSGW